MDEVDLVSRKWFASERLPRSVGWEIQQLSETGLLSQCQDDLVLHLRGTNVRDRCIRVCRPKLLVGSTEICDLRLDLPVILPVHCLIL